MGPTRQQADPVEQYAPIERPINIHVLIAQKRDAQYRVTVLGVHVVRNGIRSGIRSRALGPPLRSRAFWYGRCRICFARARATEPGRAYAASSGARRRYRDSAPAPRE